MTSLAVDCSDEGDEALAPERTADRHERSLALLHQAAATADPRERSALHEEVFLLNAPMAQAFASRYRGRGVDWDDLLQVAYMGLVKAVRGFRVADGASFAAYAAPTISGEIKRHFRDQAWVVRPPRRLQELQGAISRVEPDLTQSLGRAPAAQELSAALGEDPAAVQDALRTDSAFTPASLDAPAGDNSAATLADLVVDQEDVFERVDQILSLSPALAELSAQEQHILVLRFVYRYTQDRIGAEIGVSQMQVSRLLRGVLRKLRQRLEPFDEP